jgi:Glu-tRNA(Gln) amidotransferase subunit E-like FAD-binding protein
VYSLAPGDFATDIASRRFNAELPKDSAYQKTYKQQLELFDEHVDTAMNPIEVAKKIEEIITKKPKQIHFLVANKLQRLSVFLLKKILTQSQYEKLLAKHYNL